RGGGPTSVRHAHPRDVDMPQVRPCFSGGANHLRSKHFSRPHVGAAGDKKETSRMLVRCGTKGGVPRGHDDLHQRRLPSSPTTGAPAQPPVDHGRASVGILVGI
ncbi:unnamed protein product, partial [Ascophyllum nodosum]